MTTVQIDGNELIVRTTYAEKEKCKEILGARWDPGRKAWTYPLSVGIVRQLDEAFGSRSLCDSALEMLNPGPPPPVAEMQWKLWKHQEEAVKKLMPLPGGLLAFDMGTGKTLAAITLCDSWESSRVLIVCPKSVISVWPSEFAKHSKKHWNVLPLEDGSCAKRMKEAKKQWKLSGARNERLAIVLNYAAIIRKPLKDWLLAQHWDVMIMDESHHIKAPGGAQSITCYSLSKRADRRLGLTGTPLPHSPLDIYAQYRAIDASIFGTSFVRFRARYAIMGGYQGKVVQDFQNQDEMTRKLYSIGYRVMKRDVLDLPPVLYEDRTCALNTKEQKAYDELETQFHTWLEEGGAEVTVANTLVKLLRLQQCCSGYVMDDESSNVRLGFSKLEAYGEWMQDVPSSEPVVVFCRFTEDLEQLAYYSRKAGRSVGLLCGGVNQLAEFQAGDVDTLVCQIQAGAEGIDLTRACLCCFFSIGFSLGQYEQALARCDRPGQQRPVTIIRFMAKGTIDSKCYQALAEKKTLVEVVLKRKIGPEDVLQMS